MLLKRHHMLEKYKWTVNEFKALVRDTNIPIYKDDSGHYVGYESDIDLWLETTAKQAGVRRFVGLVEVMALTRKEESCP